MKLLVASLLLGSALSVYCDAQVTTSQYNNSRTGANIHETALTPRNVNANQFGRLFSLGADGDVYAQPLYLPRLQIDGKGRHDVIFVATEHDSVYAFDAGGQPRTLLWNVNFTNAERGITTADGRDVRCPFINPESGWSCDVGNYHGWVKANDARTPKQIAVFNTSPNDKESGIWASDTGPAPDATGNIFVATGNGKFDVPQGPDYGDTLLKLHLQQRVFDVDDYFTPSDQAELNKADKFRVRWSASPPGSAGPTSSFSADWRKRWDSVFDRPRSHGPAAAKR